jgi:hypothetical protein
MSLLSSDILAATVRAPPGRSVNRRTLRSKYFRTMPKFEAISVDFDKKAIGTPSAQACICRLLHTSNRRTAIALAGHCTGHRRCECLRNLGRSDVQPGPRFVIVHDHGLSGVLRECLAHFHVRRRLVPGRATVRQMDLTELAAATCRRGVPGRAIGQAVVGGGGARASTQGPVQGMPGLSRDGGDPGGRIPDGRAGLRAEQR